MKVAGDTVVTKLLEYQRRLGAEVINKTSGSVVLSADDFGRYTLISPDGYDQTVTMPLGDDPGQFVELHNTGYLPFVATVGGPDTIEGDPLLMNPGARQKAFVKATNQWQWWGRRYESESSRANYCHVAHNFSITQLQSGATGLGDPPTYSSMTKLDFSSGTVVLDTNAIFQSGTDDFDAPEDGYYVFEFELTLRGIGTSNTPCLIAVGVNGSQERLILVTVSVARFEAVRKKILLQLSAGDTVEVRFGSTNTEGVETRGFAATLCQLAAAHAVQDCYTSEDVDWHLFSASLQAYSTPVPWDTTDQQWADKSLVSLDTGTHVVTIQPPPVTGQKYFCQFGVMLDYNSSDGFANIHWRESPSLTLVSGVYYSRSCVNSGNFTGPPDQACIVAPSAAQGYIAGYVDGQYRDSYLNQSQCLVRRLK